MSAFSPQDNSVQLIEQDELEEGEVRSPVAAAAGTSFFRVTSSASSPQRSVSISSNLLTAGKKRKKKKKKKVVSVQQNQQTQQSPQKATKKKRKSKKSINDDNQNNIQPQLQKVTSTTTTPTMATERAKTSFPMLKTIGSTMKRKLSRGEIRAAEIRKKKQEQFLKMLFTGRTIITPWTDIEEVREVHRAIYSSVRFDQKEFGESEYGKQLIIVDLDGEECDTGSVVDPRASKSGSGFLALCFARDKLSAWKLRCRNIYRSQIIMSHLTSLESILNVLIEEHNYNQSGTVVASGSDATPNKSMLYALYSISVINFCNALTSYPSEYKIDITVRNLAQLFDCPTWIVNCRHTLSHPSERPPSMSILGEAIAFALEWMDRFFWAKAISGQFNFVSQPSPKPTQKAAGSFGSAKCAISKEQIHHETCLLLFSSAPNKRLQYKRNLAQYMMHSPNQYVKIFTEILVFGVPIHESLSANAPSLPSLLLRRSSRVFSLIFTTLPSDQMLILLLNLLIDQTILTERLCADRKAENHEYHLKAYRTAQLWLWAIVHAVTTINSPIVTEDAQDRKDHKRRQTIFAKAFDFFGDLSTLKRRHTFTWLRMLQRLTKLTPQAVNTRRLLEQFYMLIDPDVMTPDRMHQLLTLVDLFTITPPPHVKSTGLGEATEKSSPPKIKTVTDLVEFTEKKNQDTSTSALTPPTSASTIVEWSIPIGASLQSMVDRLWTTTELDPSVLENRDQYLVDEEEDEGDLTARMNNSSADIDMITID